MKEEEAQRLALFYRSKRCLIEIRPNLDFRHHMWIPEQYWMHSSVPKYYWVPPCVPPWRSLSLLSNTSAKGLRNTSTTSLYPHWPTAWLAINNRGVPWSPESHLGDPAQIKIYQKDQRAILSVKMLAIHLIDPRLNSWYHSILLLEHWLNIEPERDPAHSWVGAKFPTKQKE